MQYVIHIDTQYYTLCMLPAKGWPGSQGIAVNPFVNSGHLETSMWSLNYFYDCVLFID